METETGTLYPVVGEGGIVVIPKNNLVRAALADGQRYCVQNTPEGILLRPVDRDPDQWWFWTDEWQAGERQADEDIAAGRTTRYMDFDSFVRSLEEIDRDEA
ncbi:MAG: AbrB family transcriptional regulator [Dehalococcoidia bacterium]